MDVAWHRLRLPLLVVLAASAFGGLWAGKRLQTGSDMRDMLPDGNVEAARYDTFSGHFGSDRVLALVLSRPGGFFEPGPLQALSTLCAEIEAIPWVRRVESITHTTSVASEAGVIEARALFTDPPFDEEQAERGGREILRNPVFLDNLVSANGGTVAVMVFLEERTVAGDVVRQIPAAVEEDAVAYGGAGAAVQGALNDVGLAIARGELEGDPEGLRLAALRELAGGDLDGAASLAALLDRLTVEAETSIVRYDQEAVDRLSALLDETGAALAGDTALVGPPVLRLGLARRIQLDVQQAVIGALVLMLLLTWIGIRDPFRMPLPMGAATTSMLWTVGGMALLEIPLDQVSIAALFPSLALALASSVLLCADERPKVRTVVGVLGSGAVLAGLAALLWLSDTVAARRFATVLVMGSASAALGSVLVVGGILAVSGSRLPVAARRPRRRSVVMAAVLLGLPAAIGLQRMTVGVDYTASLLPRDPMAQAFELANDHLAGMNAFRIHLQAGERDRLKDPEVLAAVRALQDGLEELPEVDATLSYVDLIETIYGALDPGNRGNLPDRRKLVEQLLLLFGSRHALAPFVTQEYDQAAVTVRVDPGGGKALRDLTSKTGELATDLLPGDVSWSIEGELILTGQATDATTHALREAAARGLALVLALLMIVTRRIRPFLRLAVPVTVATVVSMGAACLGTTELGPVNVAVPWIGLAAGTPLALARAGDGQPGPRDWLSLAIVGACFAPLLASTLRFDAAVGIGVALGTLVASVYLWGDGGVEEE